MEPIDELILPLDILRYKIVPLTRRRELCFLRQCSRELRRAILLPRLKANRDFLQKFQKPGESHLLHLSEIVEAQYLSDEEISFLISALHGNLTIREIRMDNVFSRYFRHGLVDKEIARETEVTSPEARAVVEILQTPNKLALLDLSNRKIGPRGAELIFQTLQTTDNTTLKTLNLANSCLAAAGAMALSQFIITNKYLTSLDIATNRLRAAGTEALAAALSSPDCVLKELDLSYCLQRQYQLATLLQAIASNRSLQRLLLRGSTFKTEGAAALFTLLSTNATLEHLDLCRSHLQESAIERLGAGAAATHTLRRLVLQGCSIPTNANYALLADGLNLNSSLELLDLGVHVLGGSVTYTPCISGPDLVALLAAFQTNTKARELCFSSNVALSGEGYRVPDALACLLSSNQTLRKLSVDGKGLVVLPICSFFVAISETSTLVSLKLRNLSLDPRLGQSFASAVMDSPSLKELDLSGNTIGIPFLNAMVDRLEKPDSPGLNLECLILSQTGTSQVAAIRFAKALNVHNKALRYLDLSHSTLNNPGGLAFAELLKNPKQGGYLQYLDFSDCGIALTGLKALIKACDETKSVGEIRLHGNLSGALRNPPESVADFRENVFALKRPCKFTPRLEPASYL
jgi:Ran GTPase-activating protein (RanGAP) involved in mRNA processing and transport